MRFRPRPTRPTPSIYFADRNRVIAVYRSRTVSDLRTTSSRTHRRLKVNTVAPCTATSSVGARGRGTFAEAMLPPASRAIRCATAPAICAVALIWPRACQLLDDLKKPRGSYSNDSEIAMVYAALGDKDLALIRFDKAYRERFNPNVLLRPGFDPLRARSALPRA